VPTFHVDATDEASDSDPGDGVCATDADTCTLQAAVEEADALGRGDVLVPPDEYEVGSIRVAGEVTVRVDAPGDPTAFATVIGDPVIIVDEGGSLVLRSLDVDGWAWANGTLVLDRSALSKQINAMPTGTTILSGSFVGAGVVASGPVIVLSSTLVGGLGQRAITFAGGDVTLGGAALLAGDGGPACQQEPEDDEVDPVSIAPNHASDATCGLTGPGDVNGSADDGGEPFPNEGSPRIDAIPVGTLGCGTSLVSDIRGFPRPTDGDGDGVAACDIGAWER
jgi:hypothetical protein